MIFKFFEDRIKRIEPMTPLTRMIRPTGLALRHFGWRISVGVFDPVAYQFYSNIVMSGYDPTKTIDVVAEARVIYVSVPKAASSSIKSFLSSRIGRIPQSYDAAHNRRKSGLKAPHHVGLSRFYRLAKDPSVLKFAFVRNPYARLVSCWADKFKGKPLMPGDPFIDIYLDWLKIEAKPPNDLESTLSFPHFVDFACRTARYSLDTHWQPQSEITNVPGLTLDFVGKVESFDRDFMVITDHLGIPQNQTDLSPSRESSHRPWQDLYTHELADLVYRTFERDFAEFKYSRALTHS